MTAPILVWRRALLRADLPVSARLVGSVLAEHMDAAGTGAYPSLPTIAGEAHVHLATVARSLNVLEAAGFLHRQRGGGRGRPTRYTALLPCGQPAVDDDRNSRTGAPVSAGNTRILRAQTLAPVRREVGPELETPTRARTRARAPVDNRAAATHRRRVEFVEMDAQQRAQQSIAERQRRIESGEACPWCHDEGWRVLDDGLAHRCDHHSPNQLRLEVSA